MEPLYESAMLPAARLSAWSITTTPIGKPEGGEAGGALARRHAEAPGRHSDHACDGDLHAGRVAGRLGDVVGNMRVFVIVFLGLVV